MVQSHKGIGSSTEPDLGRGILNYGAHKMDGENGEMSGTPQTLFRVRTRFEIR